jgi:hypothetical protein
MFGGEKRRVFSAANALDCALRYSGRSGPVRPENIAR